MLTSNQADFGTVLPRLSLLATIGLAYSVISPLINGLALLGFSLFFIAWKFRKLVACVS
jgi:calcium permeable stress-gated cation channel